jgi:spore coat protein U-like protein
MKFLALCSILIAGAGTAFAGTATSNLAVTANVTASCSINAGALALTYDPVVANQATASTSTATLSVACTTGSASTITLSQGSNAGAGSTDATPLRRALNGTTDYLNYQLYSTPDYQTVWGNTNATGASHTGTGTTDTVTVYASIPASQNIPAGSYADTVVATITF